MKVFSCTFIGHYPVGACAIVVAESREDARKRFLDHVVDSSLYHKNKDIKLENFEEIDQTVGGVTIILDGDY